MPVGGSKQSRGEIPSPAVVAARNNAKKASGKRVKHGADGKVTSATDEIAKAFREGQLREAMQEEIDGLGSTSVALFSDDPDTNWLIKCSILCYFAFAGGGFLWIVLSATMELSAPPLMVLVMHAAEGDAAALQQTLPAWAAICGAYIIGVDAALPAAALQEMVRAVEQGMGESARGKVMKVGLEDGYGAALTKLTIEANLVFPWATYGAVVSPRTRPTAATIESKRKAIWGSRMSRYHERCPIWRTRVWSEGAMSYSDVDNLYLNKPEVHVVRRAHPHLSVKYPTTFDMQRRVGGAVHAECMLLGTESQAWQGTRAEIPLLFELEKLPRKALEVVARRGKLLSLLGEDYKATTDFVTVDPKTGVQSSDPSQDERGSLTGGARGHTGRAKSVVDSRTAYYYAHHLAQASMDGAPPESARKQEAAAAARLFELRFAEQVEGVENEQRYWSAVELARLLYKTEPAKARQWMAAAHKLAPARAEAPLELAGMITSAMGSAANSPERLQRLSLLQTASKLELPRGMSMRVRPALYQCEAKVKYAQTVAAIARKDKRRGVSDEHLRAALEALESARCARWSQLPERLRTRGNDGKTSLDGTHRTSGGRMHEEERAKLKAVGAVKRANVLEQLREALGALPTVRGESGQEHSIHTQRTRKERAAQAAREDAFTEEQKAEAIKGRLEQLARAKVASDAEKDDL